VTAVETASELPEAGGDARALAYELPAGRPTGHWGMYLFITTEATLFACLLAANFYIRFSTAGPWPPDGIEDPKLLKPLVMLGLLLTSSIPMIWGDLAIRKGHPTQLKIAVPTTMFLGLVFLAVQGSEYQEKLHEFTITTNAYGSLFLTITSFHALHVITGLVMLTHTWIAALRNKFTEGRHERVRMVSVYWHFVDIVWVAIVLCLYLSPHFRS